jgi:hypothetical protein
MMIIFVHWADPGDCAVWVSSLVGITGFEPCLGHKCLSFVSVVCCQIQSFCDKPIPRLEETYQVCVCVYVCPSLSLIRCNNKPPHLQPSQYYNPSYVLFSQVASFPQVFPSKILHAPLLSHVRSTCPYCLTCLSKCADCCSIY